MTSYEVRLNALRAIFGDGSVRVVDCPVCDGSGLEDIGRGDENELVECCRCMGKGQMAERPADFIDTLRRATERSSEAYEMALEVALVSVLEQCEYNAGGTDSELRWLIREAFTAAVDARPLPLREQFALQDATAIAGNC